MNICKAPTSYLKVIGMQNYLNVILKDDMSCLINKAFQHFNTVNLTALHYIFLVTLTCYYSHTDGNQELGSLINKMTQHIKGVHDTQPQISNTNLPYGNSQPYPSFIFDADISSLLNKDPSALWDVPCFTIPSHGAWGWDGQVGLVW